MKGLTGDTLTQSGATELREPAHSVFGEWIVLRETAPQSAWRLGLPMTRTEDITRALRGAMLHHAADAPPAVLSGHEPNGSPIGRPHVAFVAIPDLESTDGGGSVLGVAMLLPREITAVERRAVLDAIGAWERSGLRLVFGRAGAMQLERVVEVDPRSSLDPASWTRSSRRWASGAAVALDENPGDLSSLNPKTATEAARRTEELVARSCERIGLPRPAWAQVMRRSVFEGAPAAVNFMPFPRLGKGPRRVCVHVEMLFQEPVTGPVLIGAGRYFGLGLCRPMREGW